MAFRHVRIILVTLRFGEGDKMNVQSFSQLINTDFDLKNITVTPYTFEPCNTVEYKNGRKNNLLHFVTYGTRRYNVDGREFDVQNGDVIFIPKGTVYSCFTQKGCSGIGVCFDMWEKEDVLFSKDVYVCGKTESGKIAEYIRKMTEEYCNAPSGIVMLKALLLRAIYAFAKAFEGSETDYTIIKPALDFIAEHFCENLPVSDYATVCNISESYFRKKFCSCMGISPIEYRNELRFIKARSLYSQGKTLSEIAEITGFYDAGFFSKIYKKSTGTTLKKSIELL